MEAGRAKYVTMVAKCDVADGWRDSRHNGGLVMDVTTNEVIADGFPFDGRADTELPERAGDELNLGCLSPSDKPGSLGRLAHNEVHQILGRGAFGIVLKAVDEKLQRVADNE